MWSVISEEEHESNRHKYGQKCPQWPLQLLKSNSQGQPKCAAKYHMMALGNLDPHEWSQADCYAPVMSQQELLFITSLTVKKEHSQDRRY